LSIIAIAVAGFGLWYMILNANGPTPSLEFEVKPPDGQSVESLADVEVELDTDRNVMPAYWHKDVTENAGVRSGYVEVY